MFMVVLWTRTINWGTMHPLKQSTPVSIKWRGEFRKEAEYLRMSKPRVIASVNEIAEGWRCLQEILFTAGKILQCTCNLFGMWHRQEIAAFYWTRVNISLRWRSNLYFSKTLFQRMSQRSGSQSGVQGITITIHHYQSCYVYYWVFIVISCFVWTLH